MPTPGWGLVFSGAVVVGLMVQGLGTTDVGWRLGVLAGGGLLVDLAYLVKPTRARVALRAAAWAVAIGLAAWAASGIVGELPWAIGGLLIFVLVLGWTTWELSGFPEGDLLGPFIAIAIAGAWVTIPETDAIVILLGAAVPMGFVTLPPTRGRALAMGSICLAGLFGWFILEGGSVRPWTLAPSWATVGLIAVVALALNRRVPIPAKPWILGLQIAYVAVVTRFADISQSVLVVVGASAITLAVASLALLFLPAEKPREPASEVKVE